MYIILEQLYMTDLPKINVVVLPLLFIALQCVLPSWREITTLKYELQSIERANFLFLQSDKSQPASPYHVILHEEIV